MWLKHLQEVNPALCNFNVIFNITDENEPDMEQTEVKRIESSGSQLQERWNVEKVPTLNVRGVRGSYDMIYDCGCYAEGWKRELNDSPKLFHGIITTNYCRIHSKKVSKVYV